MAEIIKHPSYGPTLLLTELAEELGVDEETIEDVIDSEKLPFIAGPNYILLRSFACQAVREAIARRSDNEK